jgi:mevalonate kinase
MAGGGVSRAGPVSPVGPVGAFGRGHGKVILLGEHAVVYGHPALAGALGAGVVCHVEPADDDALEIEPWGVAEPIERAAQALRDALSVRTPARIRCVATVPPRAGLGSSAALAVALARALAGAFGCARAPEDIERAAAAVERLFHENPSGVDVALATRGGFGVFRRGVGLEPIAAPPLHLAVGLSGEPRSTAAMVAGVRARVEADVAARAALDRLGALAAHGRHVLGDAAALGALFDEAQRDLASLGLSTPRLDELCARARAAGAAGAKLTGAGGGGAVIAVGAERAVVAAWRAAGFDAFLAEVGACA